MAKVINIDCPEAESFNAYCNELYFVSCLSPELQQETQNQKANWLPLLNIFHHSLSPSSLEMINKTLDGD